jgi:hypothetical protein
MRTEPLNLTRDEALCLLTAAVDVLGSFASRDDPLPESLARAQHLRTAAEKLARLLRMSPEDFERFTAHAAERWARTG